MFANTAMMASDTLELGAELADAAPVPALAELAPSSGLAGGLPGGVVDTSADLQTCQTGRG